MTEQQTEQTEAAEQPSAEREQVHESEAEEQQQAPSRQERRDQRTRERLRDVEAQRDALQQRLDSRDRADVEAMARRELGEHGAGLFSFDLADLRSEDGNLDRDAVEQAIAPVKQALEEGRQVHHGDLGPRRTQRSSRTTWGQVLSSPRR